MAYRNLLIQHQIYMCRLQAITDALLSCIESIIDQLSNYPERIRFSENLMHRQLHTVKLGHLLS